MNKTEFMNELSKKLSYSLDQCIMINEIFENHFFLNQHHKDQIIEELIQRLNISHDEAIKIYVEALLIIKKEVKNKLKHPFKSKD